MDNQPLRSSLPPRPLRPPDRGLNDYVRWCQPKADDDKIDITLLEHVSPIEWDNVILYGQYILVRAQVH
jgi:hypothetical protein